MIQRLRPVLLLPVLLLPVLAVIAGCSTATSHIATQVTPAATSALNGSVHGGQQPIVGATIQLYAVGTTGDGSAATPLLSPALTTDASGGFDLTNKFTCPTSASLVYLVATGGNPGLPPPATNQQSALIVALGPCGNPTGINFISVNEVTTVAAVYALAPFMIDITDIGSGSSSSDVQALSDAFTLAWEFANPTTGSSPGSNVPVGTTIPTAQINTLANLISNCVNSAGGVSGDPSICGQLFLLTTTGGGTPAIDTITALLHLALNPGLNTASLYDLILAIAPFQPSLTSLPPDFSVRPTVPSNFTVSPTSLNFGSMFVSGTTAAQTVTITNSTTHALELTGLQFLGADPVDFKFSYQPSTPCATSSVMLPGDVCQLLVTFKPTAAGARHAYFIVRNTSANPFIPVSLSGVGTTGTAGPVTVSPSTLNFSLYNTPQPVTLTNNGNTPLSISGITFNTVPGSYVGPYTETDNCGTSLPAQSICTIDVSIHPHNDVNAVMTIADDAASGPQTVTLNAAIATNDLVPDSIDFGQQSVGTQGVLPFEIDFASGQLNFTLSGTNASDFSFSPSASASSSFCTAQAITGTCASTLYFNPSALGARTATVTVPGIGNILVTGTGVGAGPYFEVTQVSGSFATNVGVPSTTTFAGRYTGTVANTTINAPVINGPHSSEFASTSNCQNGILQSNGTCTLTVTYAPTVAETFSGTMLINDSTNTVQKTIPFVARAYAPGTTASPNQLTFGSTLAGTLSAPQSITATALTGNPIKATIFGAFQITQGATCTATPCQVSVVFAPASNASPGLTTGTLTITDPFTGNSASVYLRGTTFTQTTTSVSPGSLTFPLRSVNSTSIAQTVTVTNTGATNALTVSGATATGANPGDYVITNNCTSSVAAGSNCTIDVSFAPTAPGTRAATLTIVSNSTTTPDTVTLSGTAQ